MKPQARAALDDYAEAANGDLDDVQALADALYRAGWDDCLVAMRTFSTVGDTLGRASYHLQRAEEQLRAMRAMWCEMGDDECDR